VRTDAVAFRLRNVLVVAASVLEERRSGSGESVRHREVELRRRQQDAAATKVGPVPPFSSKGESVNKRYLSTCSLFGDEDAPERSATSFAFDVPEYLRPRDNLEDPPPGRREPLHLPRPPIAEPASESALLLLFGGTVLDPEGEHVASGGEGVGLREGRLASAEVDERGDLAVRTRSASLNPTDEIFDALIVPVRLRHDRLVEERAVDRTLEDVHRFEPQAGFDRFAEHPPQRDVAQGGIDVAVVREHATADVGMRADEPHLLERVIFGEGSVGGDPRLVGKVGAALVEGERLTEMVDVARTARKGQRFWPDSADRRDGVLLRRPQSVGCASLDL
jgi:hypothetical protein